MFIIIEFASAKLILIKTNNLASSNFKKKFNMGKELQGNKTPKDGSPSTRPKQKI